MSEESEETQAEIQQRKQPMEKANLDLIMFGILAISMLVSFLIANILVFLVALIVLIIGNEIIKGQRKKQKVVVKTEEEVEAEPKMGREVAAIRKQQRTFGVIFAALMILGFVAMQIVTEAFYIVVGVAAIGTIVAWILSRNEKEAIEKGKIPQRQSKRLEWVDMFRGLVAIFLIISVLTWELSGTTGDPNVPPIGPTYLNHGWKYYELDGWPDMITIIDIGQQILMFIVGFVGTLAFYKHQERDGTKAAITHLFRRFLALMVFSLLYDGNLMDGDMDLTSWNVNSTFWYGTFANLAWGTLISILLVAALQRKPDKRFYIVIAIFVVHALLYSSETLQQWEWIIQYNGDNWKLWEVPYNTINHIAIALMGGITYEWSLQKSEDDPHKGWKKRVLPVGAIFWAGVWLFDFIQPAHHQSANTTLSMMACATSMWILFLFYMMDQIGFKVPLIGDYGKNLLLMFILSDLWNQMLYLTGETMLRDSRIIAMLLVGIVPIVTQFFIAWSLNKLRVRIKF